MKYITYTLTFILISKMAVAQPQAKTDKEVSKEMYDKLEKVKSFPPDDYVTKTQELRKEIDRYIELKKGVCTGDFSTFVLTQKDLEESRRKLTRVEKDLCFRELRAFQVTYLNNLFIAKKNYLNFLHDQRLKKLDEIRDESLRSLKSTYDKQLISPKSKKR